MKFSLCAECGGQCCKFFVIPGPKKDNPDMEHYFSLRKGAHFMDTQRFGRVFVIELPCKNLSPTGSCMEYENRPAICRRMNEYTLPQYCVPRGCKYDITGALGEDFLKEGKKS